MDDTNTPPVAVSEAAGTVADPVAEDPRVTGIKAYWANPVNREAQSVKMKAHWAHSVASVELAKKRSVRIQDQNGVEYDSVNEAARKLNIHASNIRAHLRGRVKHVGGYTFSVISRPDGR